jgi:hypothetical protein
VIGAAARAQYDTRGACETGKIAMRTTRKDVDLNDFLVDPHINSWRVSSRRVQRSR